MNTLLTSDLKEIIGAIHYRPAVSIIMPFEPKMNQKKELAHSLDMAADKVHLELELTYPDELSMLVMQKLKKIINELDYSTYKKSIAIYVSPVFEKILYLDIAVEERVIIDESFEIRDLVYSKKQIHKYLVLLISSKESQIYLGNTTTFIKILSNTSQTEKDNAEKIANFSDLSQLKEVFMDKFLHQIDHTLDRILKAYPLPLFILGTKRTMGHFKNITKNSKSIIGYIHGNYEDATTEDLKNILHPHVENWKKIMQQNLLNLLEDAVSKGKLVTGMKDVWRSAMNGKGQLLLVEKNFVYAAEHGSTDEIIYKAVEPYNKYSYIKDAVDDVIEKILETGGDVEFVDPEMLKDYNHIALIKYY